MSRHLVWNDPSVYIYIYIYICMYILQKTGDFSQNQSQNIDNLNK